MKVFKLFLVGLFAVVSLHCQANDLTAQQRAYLEEVQQFLKQEGFVASFDEDNSLTFKKEGTLYWVDIQNSGPYFVSINREPLGIGDSDPNAVFRACNDVNANRMGVKTYSAGDRVVIVTEMFLSTTDEFKRNFYRHMKELDMAHDELIVAYSKYDPS